MPGGRCFSRCVVPVVVFTAVSVLPAPGDPAKDFMSCEVAPEIGCQERPMEIGYRLEQAEISRKVGDITANVCVHCIDVQCVQRLPTVSMTYPNPHVARKE